MPSSLSSSSSSSSSSVTTAAAQMKVKMWRTRRLLYLLFVAAFFAKAAYSNQCLTMLEEVSPKREARIQDIPVNITFGIVKRITTQRLVSRVAKIYLEEALGFAHIRLVETEDDFDIARTITELSGARNAETPKVMINMEVWVPPDFDDTAGTLNTRIDETNLSVMPVGLVTSPGHFGWFIPNRLSRQTDSWLTFTKQETAARFAVSDANLRKIMNVTSNEDSHFYCEESFCQNGMYIPAQCQSSKPCALVLSDYAETTKFVKDHIDHWKLYAKVVWVGPHLRQIIKSLSKEYLQQSSSAGPPERSLVIVHWTPSNIIPNEREYVNVVFPKCKTRGMSEGCEYETKRLEKLMWGEFPTIAKLAYEAIRLMRYSDDKYESLINKYNERLNNVQYNGESKLALIEQDVACEWLRDNLNYTLKHWMPKQEDKSILYVGGIFPMSGTFYTAKSIVLAAQMARTAINADVSVLRDYNLQMIVNDGQCKSDMVMKAFIDYILQYKFHKLIGILGPACSETIEPLAGVSKHYHTAIMSYGAEGSGFSDKTKYPYLFRTIGENRQYKYVYSQLLRKLNWNRVAAFSEDGLKYTEYISYMQDMLRTNGITFVANIKFPREWKPDTLTKYLEDLKQKRARIIISDVNDQVARQVMCEAYRLEMTAAQGYVWFLPQWLKDQWYVADLYTTPNETLPCTTEEMKKAIDGHFSISHANFAPDDSIMQEGITVREWRDNYENFCASKMESTSPYAGYAYDAMWVYAYATDELLKTDPSALYNLHSETTITNFIDIIKKTDFYGVSGRIKFVDGFRSRFPVINVYQHVNGKSHIVGSFHPNISEETSEVIGGNLDLNTSAIVWLSGKKPDDGSEPPNKCVFSGFAELLNVSCEGAIVIVNIIGFGLLGLFLLVIVVIIKRKYDQKVRAHEKYMKSLGLDLLQPDTSSLDKWEIPREQVVINRKLGEGAFGTVYGGEAFFPEKGWLAVAVKTLKVGSSTEEKLNFLSEVEVMKRFEHKNIIKLLAVCIKCEPVLTVMEFMLYGDLKTYLLARRHLVNDQHYEDSDEISNKRLTAMALDVARALSYLAQLKYVHRDVASRNCLVNVQRICKLGDFGMTRPMYENDYYKFNRKGMLPVRWMAPESLGLGIFTPASDVWSYGVLLYEIITFGSFPFQGMSNNQVLTHVKAGNSLTVPKGVKQQLEELIKSCWSVDHTKRPTAPEIVDFLATNQRVIAPCLDVPLASVQLEHTGQMEMQLSTTADRKFSFPWPGQPSTTSSGGGGSGATRNDKAAADMPFLDMDDLAKRDRNIDYILSGLAEHVESSKPLLGDTTDSGLGSGSSNSDDAARYVNMQPGVASAFLDLPSGDSISCSIPMSERHSPITGSTKFNSMSLL